MRIINEEAKFKPTLSKPMSIQSKAYEKTFNKAMATNAPNVHLNEIDSALNEVEQSLKKKIFSLPKMESLVFSDPMLTAKYDEMAENGEEKYGYHYNETIMNMLFNDYVLNSPKYLQKYKMAIPKEKKRRDKSGINQLKKAGEEMQTKNDTEIQETTGSGGGAAGMGGFAGGGSGQYTAPLGYKKEVTETTTSASSGQYSGPAMWGSGDLMKTKGKANVKTKPMVQGGTIIGEGYLTDPSGFEKFIDFLNEDDISYQQKLGLDYHNSHMGTNSGLGVSEIPQSNERENWKRGIDDNTSLYVGQDVDKMRDDDVKILHNDMTQNNSYFPHPNNPNLQNDGISGKSPNVNRNVYINDERANNAIIDKTSAFTSNTVKGWDDEDRNLELNTLNTGQADEPNLQNMEENVNEVAKSQAQQRLFGMAHAAQKGEIPMNKLGGAAKKIAKTVSASDVEDFASTKHDNLPEKVRKNNLKEDTQTMIQNNGTSMANQATPVGDQSSNVDMGARSVGGPMNESYDALLEEINNELTAFSIHHNKLKRMTEDRKPSAIVLKDRLGAENEKNFKSDLKDSSVSKIVDIENSLEFSDQQTEVGDDPMKLGQDIEKNAIKTGGIKSGEALKNVGDSANDKGDEIPKRNLTKDEQNEVNNYRLGLGDVVFDNEPGKRYEDRMKKDMGDTLYQQRQDKLAFRGKAPMYNKDTQPNETGAVKKVQFDKEKTGWNEREGLSESMITGRFTDILGKKHLIDFTLNEVNAVESINEGLFPLDFSGLGNSYVGKSVNSHVIINESVVNAMNSHKFYTDGKKVYAVKNSAQNINESENKGDKKVLNEGVDKIKHLLGYKPQNFVNTQNVKKNRGF